MFGLGLGEIVLIGVVLLLFVGPERLPGFMRQVGKYYAQIRRTSDDLRRAFTLEADRMDADERYAKLQERRRQAEEARRKAAEEAAAKGQAVQPPTHAPSTKPAPHDTDPEAPAPRLDLPPGVTPEEWQKLPPHVRDLLRQVPKETALTKEKEGA
jgi:sec-independent protein translocase protein TatB